jgi:hypothetical protein
VLVANNNNSAECTAQDVPSGAFDAHTLTLVDDIGTRRTFKLSDATGAGANQIQSVQLPRVCLPCRRVFVDGHATFGDHLSNVHNVAHMHAPTLVFDARQRQLAVCAEPVPRSSAAAAAASLVLDDMARNLLRAQQLSVSRLKETVAQSAVATSAPPAPSAVLPAGVLPPLMQVGWKCVKSSNFS